MKIRNGFVSNSSSSSFVLVSDFGWEVVQSKTTLDEKNISKVIDNIKTVINDNTPMQLSEKKIEDKKPASTELNRFKLLDNNNVKTAAENTTVITSNRMNNLEFDCKNIKEDYKDCKKL